MSHSGVSLHGLADAEGFGLSDAEGFGLSDAEGFGLSVFRFPSKVRQIYKVKYIKYREMW